MVRQRNSRGYPINRANMGLAVPHTVHEFRGSRDDFIWLAAQAQMIARFLQRPDAADILDANPDLEADLDVFIQAITRVDQYIKFFTADRSAAKYGLTGDQFWDIVKAQQWSCAICKCEFEPGGTRMNVDHNHDTADVRGILCSSCNTGLGMFKDSPDIIDAALAYLEEHGCYGADSAADRP